MTILMEIKHSNTEGLYRVCVYLYFDWGCDNCPGTCALFYCPSVGGYVILPLYRFPSILDWTNTCSSAFLEAMMGLGMMWCRERQA